MAQKLPKMAQKLAPAEKDSTEISAASATFCVSEPHSNVSVWCTFQWVAAPGPDAEEYQAWSVC